MAPSPCVNSGSKEKRKLVLAQYGFVSVVNEKKKKMVKKR